MKIVRVMKMLRDFLRNQEDESFEEHETIMKVMEFIMIENCEDY